MPVLQVYYPQGTLVGEHKVALARSLTDVLLRMEGAVMRQPKEWCSE